MINHEESDDLLGHLPGSHQEMSRQAKLLDTLAKLELQESGRKEMHLANGRPIRALRKKRGWSQKKLATRAGICTRTLRTMELGEECTKLSTIRRVACALEVDVTRIQGPSKASLVPTHRWEDLLIPVRDYPRVRQALACDMRGEFDRAVALLDEGLARLDPSRPDEFRDWAFFSIKKFSILSNSGRHQEGLEGLERLARHKSWQIRQSTDLFGLLRYHRAVTMRRLGLFMEAAAEFGELLERKHQASGARHQLGVVCLEQGLAELRKNADMTLLDLAKMHLEKSRSSWEQEGGGYRVGFSLRRLAEVARAVGEPDTAAALYELACQRFADDECERYLEATREDIARLARERG